MIAVQFKRGNIYNFIIRNYIKNQNIIDGKKGQKRHNYKRNNNINYMYKFL